MGPIHFETDTEVEQLGQAASVEGIKPLHSLHVIIEFMVFSIGGTLE